jgi:hypothetical protein
MPRLCGVSARGAVRRELLENHVVGVAVVVSRVAVHYRASRRLKNVPLPFQKERRSESLRKSRRKRIAEDSSIVYLVHQ